MLTVLSSFSFGHRFGFASARGLMMALVLAGFVFGNAGVVRADEAAADSSAHVDDDHADHKAPDHDREEGEHGDHGASAEGGHGSHDEAGVPPLLQVDFGSAICNLAIFLIVLGILSKFVWPVILDGLKAREQKIHGDLVAAEKANAEAKALLADYQTKLDEAASKVQSMLADARKDAEAAGQKIVDEAKAEAERQTNRAVSDIETAKKVALADLAGKTSDMALAVAGEVVGRELKADDHAELIRQSLGQLPSNN